MLKGVTELLCLIFHLDIRKKHFLRRLGILILIGLLILKKRILKLLREVKISGLIKIFRFLCLIRRALSEWSYQRTQFQDYRLSRLQQKKALESLPTKNTSQCAYFHIKWNIRRSNRFLTSRLRSCMRRLQRKIKSNFSNTMTGSKRKLQNWCFSISLKSSNKSSH